MTYFSFLQHLRPPLSSGTVGSGTGLTPQQLGTVGAQVCGEPAWLWTQQGKVRVTLSCWLWFQEHAGCLCFHRRRGARERGLWSGGTGSNTWSLVSYFEQGTLSLRQLSILICKTGATIAKFQGWCRHLNEIMHVFTYSHCSEFFGLLCIDPFILPLHGSVGIDTWRT